LPIQEIFEERNGVAASVNIVRLEIQNFFKNKQRFERERSSRWTLHVQYGEMENGEGTIYYLLFTIFTNTTKKRPYPFMFQKNLLLNSKKIFQRPYLQNHDDSEVKTLLLLFNRPD
jgi:hypothetical protein